MKKVRGKRRPPGRRRWLTGSGLVAAVLAVAAVAWACTQQVGTLKVCAPIPTADLSGGDCTQKTGNGSQAGGIQASVGDAMSVTATNMNATGYSILFSTPTAVATGVNCHLASGSGVKSLIGNNPGGTPRTLLGPNFQAGTRVAQAIGQATPSMYPSVKVPASNTGTAKICVQDEPSRVTGNQIVMAII